MDDENEEEGYTLTSFEPLSPAEDEETGIRRFIKGLKRKKLNSQESPQSLHDSQSNVESSSQNKKQVHQNVNTANKETLQNESHAKGLHSKRDEGKRQELDQEKVEQSRNYNRTPSSVLRRLSQLVLLEKANPQQSQGSNNLKQYWMPDEQCKVCYECGVKFHTFRRRHHCRLCGQIFCSRCCNEVVSGHQFEYTGVFRVCIYCKKVVVTYTSGSDIENNLQQLKHDLHLVAQPDSTNSTANIYSWNASLDDPELNRSFDVLGVSAEEANMLKQDSFKELWQQISAPKTGLDFVNHRIRLRTYSTCFVGRDLINWLMINRKAPNRSVALQICVGLQDLGWIEPLSGGESAFNDEFTLYIPGPRANGEISPSDLRSPSFFGQAHDRTTSQNAFCRGQREPVSWLSTSFDQSIAESKREGFRKSSSASTLVNQVGSFPCRVRSLSYESVTIMNQELTIKQSTPYRGTVVTEVGSSTPSPGLDAIVNVEDCYLPSRLVSEQGTKDTGDENDVTEEAKKANRITAKDLRISSSEESAEQLAFEKLCTIHDKHISRILVQLLDRIRLSQSWKDTIEALAVKVCQQVEPNVGNDDEMDARHYVKIKKIPGGLRTDCRIVNGVVCTKNVVHKKMSSVITQPRILMLACPLDFQRVENKMASLDSLVLQEEEFLKNMVARILALKPGLVLVEKTVSRLAQDMLLSSGISVILNIKPKLMARISRCVEGDILLSLDQGSRPKLGSCQKFKIKKFVFKDGSAKTLTFFEGCNPKFGSTIILRGASRKELAKVKNVLKFMIFVAYNSKLEKAFIMDEFGTPFVLETDKNSEGQADETASKELSRQNTVDFSVEGETLTSKENVDLAKTENNSERDVTTKETRAKTSSDENSEIECEESEKSSQEIPDSSNKSCDNVVNSESFQSILDSIVLCSSPLVKYPLPYVLTPEGKKCELREFMTGDVYWSPLFSGENTSLQSSSEDAVDNAQEKGYSNVFIKKAHPFVIAVLEKDAKELNAVELLANYRAEGGRITLRERQTGKALDGADELDGIMQGAKIHMGTHNDGFVPTSRSERTGSDQYQERLPPMRDCFDPFLHQMIAVMFSSYSRESGNFPRPCITPWTVFMEFYARNDITLGCFLEKYCFRSSYVCPNPNCDIPMVNHVRYFAHGDGAVYINMKNLESPIPGFSKTLLTWSWCKQCRQVTPVLPVSADAWRLSFAKYLELRNYATCYRRRASVEPCGHSLHQDHYQYFAFNNIVASLKYVPVIIYEVRLPTTAITIIEVERQPQFWIKHIQAMSVRVHQLITLINDRIAALKTEGYISNCVSDIAYDRGQLLEKIKVLDSKAMLLLSPSASPGDTEDNRLLEPHEVSAVEYEILDGITFLKRMMCEYCVKWNTKLVELLQLEKKSLGFETKNSSSTQTSTKNPVESSQNTNDSVFSNEITAPQLDSTASLTLINPFSPENYLSTPMNTQSTTSNLSLPTDILSTSKASGHEVSQGLSDSSNTSELGTIDEAQFLSFESEVKVKTRQRDFSNSSNQNFEKHTKLWATLTEEVNSTLKDVQYVEDRPDPKMKRIISHILPGVSFRSIPYPFPIHEHHLLPVSDVIPIVVNEREVTSIIAYTLSSPDYQKKLQLIQESMESVSESFTCVHVNTDGGSSISSENITSRSRTRSEVETLSSSSLMNTLDDDFVDDYFQWSELDEEEAINDPKHSSEDEVPRGERSNDTIKKPLANKPTEIGANQIENSTDEVGRRKGKSKQRKITKKDGISKIEDSMEKFVETERGKENEVSLSDGVRSPEEDGKESSAQEHVEFHINHRFSDSSAKFLCVVHFGEQFRRIRKAVFPDGEEKYIRSLQYCMNWHARGGKSGSSFCKTTDDRFVIKEMSRPEAQSFLYIAPYYFQYIEKAIEEKRPTLLAKILGVYRIVYKSKITNTLVKKDLLVMDNLLYNCKVDMVFDLKGSIRSRYAHDQENNVLLDENLLEIIAESPLFIRPYSKAVLSRAINNDTEFLAKHMVMDYSLLMGIEKDSFTLNVGIIDFIRTFTWDKKLEMYVKSTGILGGQGKMPTVVSPELYRQRFCEAMQRYFLMIPNKWMGLGNDIK